MDAQVKRAVRELARELREIQSQVRGMQRGVRGPHLPYSSIDSGSVEVRDSAGQVRQRWGWLPDGTVGTISEGGDPPPAPTAPTVTPSIGGLRVTWDGALANELALPGDFDHMAVHVSTTSGFTPSAATFVGGIRREGEGGMLPVIPLPYQEHYVVLVPVTTGGVTGTPSAEAAATPLQVDGADLTPGSVTTPILAAGAVTAEKLEAVLALVTTIVAGVPGAARVELDQGGIRGYNTDNQLVFAVDAAGNAVFSGDITGSDITGSSFRVDDADDDSYINIGPATLGLDPTALAIEVVGSDSSSIEMGASGAASVDLTPPPGPTEDYRAGLQWAYVITAGDDSWQVPAAAYTSPKGDATLPSAAQAELQLEGGSDTVNAARVRMRGDVVQVSMAGFTQYAHGVVEVDPELTIRSEAHAYEETVLQAQPTGSGSGGDWVDFTDAQFPAIVDFHTGYSGRVRITIKHVGICNATPGSTLSTGFRLSGATTLAADLPRAAMTRAAEPRGGGTNSYGIQQQQTIYLTLPGDSDITLTPAWRTSSSPAWGSGTGAELQYDFSYTTSIVIENLM